MIQPLIFSPADAAKLAIQTIDDLKDKKGTGITTGISSIDAVMLPFRPAELISIIGYTSNYKSGFMNWLVKQSIAQSNPDEITIKVTWEDSVEEETLKWIASDADISISTLVKGELTDYEPIHQSYKNRINTPLWIIGHSNRESAEGGKARPRMTMTDVAGAIEFIRNEATDNKYRIKMVVLDYLQRIRPDATDGHTKREQMMEAVNKAKDLAIRFGTPVVLGVQASRSVLDREVKLPRLDDGLETSNIEQSSEKVISLWYPIKTESEGKKLEISGMSKVFVNQNLLVCGLLKQKFGVAPKLFPLWIDPSKNKINAMTTQ